MITGSLEEGACRETIRYGSGARGTLGNCLGVGNIGDVTGGGTLRYGACSGAVEGAILRAFLGVGGSIG